MHELANHPVCKQQIVGQQIGYTPTTHRRRPIPSTGLAASQLLNHPPLHRPDPPDHLAIQPHLKQPAPITSLRPPPPRLILRPTSPDAPNSNPHRRAATILALAHQQTADPPSRPQPTSQPKPTPRLTNTKPQRTSVPAITTKPAATPLPQPAPSPIPRRQRQRRAGHRPFHAR
jgi:hypothetical protein